jgi:hypothetical protein
MSMFNDIGLVEFRNRKEENGRWRDDEHVISRSRWNERGERELFFFVSLSLSFSLSLTIDISKTLKFNATQLFKHAHIEQQE